MCVAGRLSAGVVGFRGGYSFLTELEVSYGLLSKE